ncbi:MAG: thiamine pyrophosphate-binding protein [Oleiphilaceae bacterium]|nr:thiamine pyrophosphate-binding protein [Oleiphilaceae bacterium]
MVENGDLIVSYLERLGIEYVFGVPGGSIEPLYNALARSARRGGPRAVLARHETGAAFMADGYARATGKLGVVCSTSGPGATNLLTGVANAFADEIPLLVISGQPSIERFGLGAFQEGSCTGINTVSMFDSCTRYNTLVSHPAQLEAKLVQAISFAKSRHPGPVHLSVPLDIMKAKVKAPDTQIGMRAFINHDIMPSREGQELVLSRLAKAKKVTLVIGHGCANDMDDILAMAEAKRWLLVTTPMAKGLVPNSHPLYRGVFGLGGHESARMALLEKSAEHVVVIGSALDEVTTGGWDEKAIFSNRLIHISDNPEHLCRSIMARLSVLGSPSSIVRAFLEQHCDLNRTSKINQSLDTHGFHSYINYRDRDACLDMGAPVKPQSLFWHMSQWVPEGTQALMDTGNSFLWGVHYWQSRQHSDCRKKLFHIGMGFASMGWAIGSAIGMAFADPEKPVVCFTGDGSLLMSGQEITVAQEHSLNIVFVILNDAHLGMIKHGQALGGAENIANNLPQVDFAMMAKSMGVHAYTVDSMEELQHLDVNSLFQRRGPVLLDVHVDAQQVPPMSSRVKVLRQTEEPVAFTHKASQVVRKVV